MWERPAVLQQQHGCTSSSMRVNKPMMLFILQYMLMS
jgi:hypothetical protein